ncbi:MAG TPA: Maf family protein [Candidatus Polarisedimenticolaceae bacterium]|nr:Maf family protein [Candidatus Polarisedimenticolaceae bacterium]
MPNEIDLSSMILVLASGSPRRLELLRGMGLAPEVVPSGLPERFEPGEPPRALVRRLAEAKGRDVLPRLRRRSVVLAADTEVTLDGRVLGKPRDADHAVEMLLALCGREHEVLTGVFLVRSDDGRSVCEVESTRVAFRRYDRATIERYVATGEPMDKAGAYAIQGEGSRLVRSVVGSWSNVVGLPCERLGPWLERIGLSLAALRRLRAD